MTSMFTLLWQHIHLHPGRWLNVSGLTLGSISFLTSNWISLFFTVAVATTAMIYNLTKTVIAWRKERRDRLDHDRGIIDTDHDIDD